MKSLVDLVLLTFCLFFFLEKVKIYPRSILTLSRFACACTSGYAEVLILNI